MKILKINSSALTSTSISRTQVDLITSKLIEKHVSSEVLNRDVAYSNLPFLDEKFVQAMFQRGNLTQEQEKALEVSDGLINELQSSDIIVIGAPMYNFTIPASLKAYFDLIARPGKTFNYTSSGQMVGLLQKKTAIVVITSGGTPIGSSMDFSKEYIRSFLKFIGINNVNFIELDQTGFRYNEKMKEASNKLNSILEMEL